MKQSLALTRFNAQKASAGKRGIKFNLTFEEWYNWWLSNGIDKNISQGKKTKDTLCMCRFGDIGDYDLNNIYCDTVSGNSSVIDKYKYTGTRKSVQTPLGIFRSLTEAGIAHNFPIWRMSLLVREHPDFNFVNPNHYKKDLSRK